MKSLTDQLTDIMKEAFATAGYADADAAVTLSNRPDLAEFQCNGAMAAAKLYHKAPIVIANEIVETVKSRDAFEEISAIAPGFINIRLSSAYLASYLGGISAAESFAISMIGAGKTAVLDYGGANVAKPLHVGHLRAAIIGESIKRIYRYNGYKVYGDVHLGDWGLQMGLIIEGLRERKPYLPYFDRDFSGDYPSEAPFTISDLEEIYPAASAKAKNDEAFAAKAHAATAALQAGDRGFTALFHHIIAVSVTDLKKNYGSLGVSFDLWNGESDAQKYIPEMLDILRAKKLMHESEGAMVVDVAREDDAKEIPPCIIIKSDGASLYATTDLATLLQREKDYAPDNIVYVVDKRQSMHFTQVFRTAKKAGIVPEETFLFHLGFGTMNGRDGKPFKTRDGGVLRLEYLIKDINEAVYNRITAGELEDATGADNEEARKNAEIIGLAAIKYGDLSNQATKDYVFDIDRFTSFEGNTGPYILYTIVRIKSILKKFTEAGGTVSEVITPARTKAEKELQLVLTRAGEVIEGAAKELAPHRICQYIYELSNAFNTFYHETKILAETDKEKQSGYISLLNLALRVLNENINLLGFSAPERM